MHHFVEVLVNINNSILPHPINEIVNGIGFGVNLTKNSQLWKNMQISGLLHIVVLSGANIVLLVAFLDKILYFVKRKPRSLVILICIIFYVYLCGASPSLIRAMIMGIITQFSILIGRRSYNAVSLLFAFIIMWIVDPSNLSDLSFILSFSACLGIVLFKDDIESFLKRTRLGEVKSEIALSISAQVLVVPLIFWFYSTISLASTIATLLVFPVIVPIMIMAWILPIIHQWTPEMAMILTWFTYYLGQWVYLIATFIGESRFLFIKI